MSPLEKSRKSRREIMIAALIVTLVVNALFLVVFDYSPPPPLKVPEKPFRTMMLDLSSPQRHWYHDVGDWFQFQNPSLMSRPDYRFGYSRYAKMPLYRAVLPSLVLNPPQLVSGMAVSPFGALQAQPYPSRAAGPAELQGLRILDPRSANIVYPQTEPLLYPLVVVNGMPMRKIRFGAVDIPPGGKPTRVRLTAEEGKMLPRARITGSSGSAELDREAVRVLLEYAAHAPLNEWNSYELVVYWQKEGEEAS